MNRGCLVATVVAITLQMIAVVMVWKGIVGWWILLVVPALALIIIGAAIYICVRAGESVEAADRRDDV